MFVWTTFIFCCSVDKVIEIKLNMCLCYEFHIQVVVSDHGMTANGNHGGSSYEETDSLALFIGLKNDVSDFSLSKDQTICQVIII